jgi:hypothetical protein
MLKLFALIIGLANAQTVDMSKYFVMANVVSAKARSQAQCNSLGCDHTRSTFWWEVVPLTDGTAAVRVQSSGVYGNAATIGPCAVGCGLTPAEILTLQTAAQLGTLIATPVNLP